MPLAKGKNFGPWKNRAGNPIKCLYFEGEMHPYDFRERLFQMDTNENFYVFSVGGNYMEPNSFSRGNLTQKEYREAMAIEILDKEFQFVVIDNLASLAPGINDAPELNENIQAEYDPINQWLLSLRACRGYNFFSSSFGQGWWTKGNFCKER